MEKRPLNALVIAGAAIAAALAVGQTVRHIGGPEARAVERERCYGVAKAGKNDCGTPHHSCASQSRKDGDAGNWIMLPKGICERLVGGATQPGQ